MSSWRRRASKNENGWLLSRTHHSVRFYSFFCHVNESRVCIRFLLFEFNFHKSPKWAELLVDLSVVVTIASTLLRTSGSGHVTSFLSLNDQKSAFPWNGTCVHAYDSGFRFRPHLNFIIRCNSYSSTRAPSKTMPQTMHPEFSSAGFPNQFSWQPTNERSPCERSGSILAPHSTHKCD